MNQACQIPAAGPAPASLLSDPFWRRVASHPALQHSYWTKDQLTALYAHTSEATSEHFFERVGVLRFDGGWDELAAFNIAHLETLEWMESRLARIDVTLIGQDQESMRLEREARARGIDPSRMLYLPEGTR